MAKNTKTVGISLPFDQIRELERLSIDESRTKSFFVQRALADFFEKLRAERPGNITRRELVKAS